MADENPTKPAYQSMASAVAQTAPDTRPLDGQLDPEAFALALEAAGVAAGDAPQEAMIRRAIHAYVRASCIPIVGEVE